MDVARYAELFHTESQEQLAAVEQALVRLEQGADPAGAVVELFRAVHTLKGMSAAMGYAAVSSLAHALESVLEPLRGAAAPPARDVVDVLFRATDSLRRAVDAAVSGEVLAVDAPVLEALQAVTNDAATRGRPSAVFRALEAPAAGRVAASAGPRAGYAVHVELAEDCVMPGVRAVLLLRVADGLGAVSGLAPARGALAALVVPVPITFHLLSDAPRALVESRLRAVGEVRAVVVSAPARAATEGVARSVRVDVTRLDRLLALVGELVLARGQLERAAGAGPQSESVTEAITSTARLVGALQQEILAARLVPVGQVFDRFPRVVRDAARATGKQVDFVLDGREIELDRALLDDLSEPLVHLLRNAVDHGLEPPSVREAAGKAAVGRVTLSAARERSAVVIRVSDDGRGIDREVVRTAAIARGILAADHPVLDDGGLLRVLATPGFSMAASVTDLSGRGVGVDAVLAQARRVGGAVELRTAPGEGTQWSIRLPLTVAIVRALLVAVDGRPYAIPLTHVRETVDLVDVETWDAERMQLRGAEIPLVSARALMQVAGAPADRPQVVLLERGDRTVGVVVDGLLGQREIVVEQLDAVRGARALFSGATRLPDGTLALILDAGSLM